MSTKHERWQYISLDRFTCVCYSPFCAPSTIKWLQWNQSNRNRLKTGKQRAQILNKFRGIGEMDKCFDVAFVCYIDVNVLPKVGKLLWWGILRLKNNFNNYNKRTQHIIPHFFFKSFSRCSIIIVFHEFEQIYLAHIIRLGWKVSVEKEHTATLLNTQKLALSLTHTHTNTL